MLPWVFITPAVVLMILFTVVPAINALILSFQQLKVTGGLLGTGAPVETFVGFKNYINILSTADFWQSIGRMLRVAVIGVPTTIVVAIVLALCLDARRTRLVGATKLAIFLPYAVPGVIASLLWGFMYIPSTSPIGGNLIDYVNHWHVYFAVANIAIWGGIGFDMVVFYTALRAVPTEIFEAAQVDGASELQIALRIKFPLILPSVSLIGLFAIIGGLQLFGEPVTLSQLSKGITSTWTPVMRIYYDAIDMNDTGDAAAASFVMMIMIVFASVLVSVIGRRASGGGIRK